VWSLLEIQEIAAEIEAVVVVVDSGEEAEMAGAGIPQGQKRITGL
jgi:hypothetical protein